MFLKIQAQRTFSGKDKSRNDEVVDDSLGIYKKHSSLKKTMDHNINISEVSRYLNLNIIL